MTGLGVGLKRALFMPCGDAHVRVFKCVYSSACMKLGGLRGVGQILLGVT